MRIECRAFVAEIPEVSCCTHSNHKSLCQPDTDIARVIVDVLSASHPNASNWCKVGFDINTISELALNDSCPKDERPAYCSKSSGLAQQTTPGRGITVVQLTCCGLVVSLFSSVEFF